MNPTLLYQWKEEIARHLPALNSWQQENVALFSCGVIQAEACQQQRVSRHCNEGERVTSTQRRWRRFLANERFPMQSFWEQWCQWVRSALPEGRLSLLVDETKLRDRIGVLMVGVAWEGRCIPLIWRCYRANDADAYPEEGQVKVIEQMLSTVKKSLAPQQEVLVLADRGIGTSPKLCQAVERLQWNYLFRITKQSKIITQTGEYTIGQQVEVGEVWQAEGKVFKQRGRIEARAIASWSEGYREPWLLVTNDPQVDAVTYAQRNWQEQSFRDLKSGGWHWGDSRVRHVDHMERLLVILVVAYGWIVALGSQAVARDCHQPLHRPKQNSTGNRKLHPSEKRPRRQWSFFKEGLRFFTEYVHRYGICLGLVFIPDKRFLFSP